MRPRDPSIHPNNIDKAEYALYNLLLLGLFLLTIVRLVYQGDMFPLVLLILAVLVQNMKTMVVARSVAREYARRNSETIERTRELEEQVVEARLELMSCLTQKGSQ